MANSYNTNPIVLDSTMAATAKNTAGGLALTNPLRISGFWWDAPGTTAGHQCTLQDGNGNVIFNQTVAGATTTTANSPLMFGQPWVVNDFKLTALQEGKLYIYLAQ